MLTIKEANALVGRIVWKDETNYTVTGTNHPQGLISVWNPKTHTALYFDSVETFENWAYGKPVPSGQSVIGGTK